MNKQQADKLFNMFIQSDETRDLGHPFKQDGLYVATDAHSMIWIECSKMGDLGYESQIKPQITKILPSPTDEVFTFSIKELEDKLVPYMTDEYKHTGDDIDCNDCCGIGQVEWEYMDNQGKTHTADHDCPICDGSGYSARRRSVKTGNQVPDTMKEYEVFDAYFSYKQLIRLVKAVKEIGVDETIVNVHGKTKPFIFEAKGFKIMVCPLISSDYPHKIELETIKQKQK